MPYTELDKTKIRRMNDDAHRLMTEGGTITNRHIAALLFGMEERICARLLAVETRVDDLEQRVGVIETRLELP